MLSFENGVSLTSRSFDPLIEKIGKLPSHSLRSFQICLLISASKLDELSIIHYVTLTDPSGLSCVDPVVSLRDAMKLRALSSVGRYRCFDLVSSFG